MITIKMSGRLGNQMFQYSVCRIIAEKNGYDFFISTDESHGQNISNYFNLYMGNGLGNIKYQYCEDHTIQIFNPGIFNIKDNTEIWGFYQSDQYFCDRREDVKSWFHIDIKLETRLILEKYNINEYCFIHFRGTDYKDWDMGTRFLPKLYFENAINHIKMKKKDIKFVVITDDIESAKFYFNNFDIICNDMMIDFQLLYYSKYCIISNSTFSWWAAWLSEKIITVAPNNWLNYNNPELGFYPKSIKSDRFEYV